VGSKVADGIDQVLVREGDRVQPGQVLVERLMTKELKAGDGTVAGNAAEVRSAANRKEDIAESRAAAAKAKAEYEQRRNGYRQKDIAAAQAGRGRAQAEEVRSI